MAQTLEKRKTKLPEGLTPEEVIADYRLAYQSRQASLLGRREVLTGKAKFGIFGDGKEVAQIALAKAARPGDFRSGYYRDQTFMFALGLSDIQKFFAQLYADTDLDAEPASGGRQMNGHYATRTLDDQGRWKDLTATVQSAADCSPTASQMPRLVGLAQASKIYRNVPVLKDAQQGFSKDGNELAFGTIGDASTSEGLFWESINAAGVLQVPLVMSVWDDNFGISVPITYQTTKASISEALAGFQATKEKPGYDIHTVKAWDYAALVKTYRTATEKSRKQHTPALIHVQEVTQPQGHSTSGSHERYKSPERLAWEQEYDCVAQMRNWILAQGIATEAQLEAWEKEDKKMVSNAKNAAWTNYTRTIKAEMASFQERLQALAAASAQGPALLAIADELGKISEPFLRDIYVALRKALVLTIAEDSSERRALLDWKADADRRNYRRFNSHLHSESAESALLVPETKPEYPAEPEQVDGRLVVRACFDAALERDPRVMAFGEDLGFLGDVNQGFEGMQKKYGELRISDTGIREATIIGQGIGLAMRGLRPIAEIQYLDYLLYAIQLLSDDLATLQYRTSGGQKAPLIIRTRGHRLEGIWHSGSPMGMILNSLRGIHVLVPRDMTRAAGFYNTLLQSDEPALIIEVLNGYRRKEPMPLNPETMTVPLGVPETLRSGTDITLVTYGPCCRIALEAADILQGLGISLEVIDVQSLLPFDRHHHIVQRLQRTNRLIVLDEDVPGGASAFMLQQILEVQGGYRFLDSAPITITSQAHRPAYADDGDYFSKSQVEDVLREATAMMAEFDPSKYKALYS